ncbi:MAG: alginate lyase family protein [Thermodesulfobacteriota bacterium]
MMMSRLKFYAARLGRASFRELWHRAREKAFLTGLAAVVRFNLSPERPPAGLEISPLSLPSTFSSADDGFIEELVSGRVFSLNQDQGAIRDFEIRNRTKLFTQVVADDPEPDLRAVWEPARLQHLSIVLAKIGETPSVRAAGELKGWVRNVLLAWISENRFPYGPHYMSAMECGLRIPVFLSTLQTLDVLTPDERKMVVRAVYQHAWLIRRRLSLFSSLGNHTVAECLGLILAGGLFRESRPGRDWLRTGLSLLEQEVRHQILDDGGPAEQSFHYHRFVLDLYWLAVEFLEKNGLHDCAEIKKRLSRGELFLAAFSDGRGAWPAIGDGDDGQAIAPGVHPARESAPDAMKIEAGRPVIQTFPDSGYTVVRTSKGAIFTFDHGGLGLPPLFNHGHADALSVTLAKNSRPILVDPGTFRYNGVLEWRKYFKGTRAHNTVTVEGLDQSDQITGFIWAQGYEAGLTKSLSGPRQIVLSAFHDGYARLNSPVRHWRTVVLLDQNVFIIKDVFEGQGENIFELNFHFHPEASVNRTPPGWEVSIGRERAFLTMPDGEFTLVEGQRDPILGWYSSAYGLKTPSPVLNLTRKGSPAEVSFTTIIALDNPVNQAEALAAVEEP